MSRPSSRKSIRNGNDETGNDEDWGNEEDGDWEWEYYYEEDYDGDGEDQAPSKPNKTVDSTKPPPTQDNPDKSTNEK